MCVGPSNCGKTTWLEPILCVVDHRKLATCTDEGVFGAQSVETDTEMIVLDDWDPGKIKNGLKMIEIVLPIKLSVHFAY